MNQPYPLIYDVEHQEEYSRFMPLIKWLLVIPHLILMFVYAIGVFFAVVFAWFAVLFTARYPRGLFDFVIGFTRFTTRVSAYALLMTDKYPPFGLRPEPEDRARYDVTYPEEGVERWRPLFAWFLIIPYHIVAAILGYVAAIITFFAFFTILFTKKYPLGMFNITLNCLRWTARSNAYAYFLVTRYPPWEWDPDQPQGPGT